MPAYAVLDPGTLLRRAPGHTNHTFLLSSYLRGGEKESICSYDTSHIGLSVHQCAVVSKLPLPLHKCTLFLF
jgi:hypothetical protein